MTNSNLPLWHDDLFACYPAMIDRLQTLVKKGTVKVIKEADDISDLFPDGEGGSRRLPLDGAIYVIFDSINPIGDGNDDGKNQEQEIGFSLVFTVKKYNFRGLSGMSVGKVLAQIGKCMNGFEPVKDGRALTLSPFEQRNPLPVQYKNGFGYFSLRYVTTVATYADNLD